MTNRHMSIAAAVALSLVFALGRAKSSPAVTLHYLGATPYGEGSKLSIGVSNHTGNVYCVNASKLETCSGNEWIECPGGSYSFGPMKLFGPEDVNPYGGGIIPCYIRQLPPGAPLRLVIVTRKASRGLDSLPSRMKVWLSGRNRRVSLNPFDKRVYFYREPIAVVGPGFCAP